SQRPAIRGDRGRINKYPRRHDQSRSSRSGHRPKCERSLWPYLVLDLPPPSSVRPLLGSGEHAARYREALGLGVGVGVALGLEFAEVAAPRPARAAACALEICSCILAMFCAYAARSPLRSAACACA